MVDCPVYFAPLQGYTDAPYRNYFHTYFGGVDVYYTPFVPEFELRIIIV